jgi:hypothetical protein
MKVGIFKFISLLEVGIMRHPDIREKASSDFSAIIFMEEKSGLKSS